MKNNKKEKELHKEIILGVINANYSADLLKELTKLNEWDWADSTRRMFLIGLLQGALMQFKKDVAVEELEEIFMTK